MKIIFGGAFNPIHDEHVNMIKHLLSLEETEKVIILPSANPPHKKCDTLFSQRVDMIKLAVKGLDRVEICEIENLDKVKHYTCEVLPKLKEIYSDIAFVIGGDSLIDLSKWKNPQDIIKICPLYVFTRGENANFYDALDYWRARGGDIRICDYAPKDVSSTLIRFNVRLDKFDGVCMEVADYIRRHSLYRDYYEMRLKLKSSIPLETFEHCSSTAGYALFLNYSLKLGIDYDKVFLAGLFHDCAKTLCHTPHDVKLVPPDSVGTPVEHQFLGAIVAKEVYGIEDIDVLNAIKYHTTGKKSMTALEKLIFCADMLEPLRSYPEVDHLRASVNKSLDLGYRECVLAQYEFLKQNGGDIYPLTLEAVEGVK